MKNGPEMLSGAAIAVILVMLGYAWLTFEPDPIDMPSCNCQGKTPDCHVKVFDDGRTRAQCALWDKRSSCCVVVNLKAPPSDGRAPLAGVGEATGERSSSDSRESIARTDE